jgi:hypothetical protein
MFEMPATEPEKAASPELTRRRLVQVGAAGAATIWLGKVGEFTGIAQAAGSDGLRRSSYLNLTGQDFKVSAGGRSYALQLISVDDLPIASEVPALRDSEDAFSLRFRGDGRSTFAQGIHELSHAQLGTAALFIAPIEKPGSSQDYEVVVDRTVKIPGLDEKGAPAPVNPAQRASSDSPRKLAAHHAVPRLTTASLRRSTSGRKLLADVSLANAGAVTSVRATLTRRGRVVASAGSGSRRGRSLLRFGIKAPRRAARYDLVLLAIDADGHVTKLSKPVRLGDI